MIAPIIKFKTGSYGLRVLRLLGHLSGDCVFSRVHRAQLSTDCDCRGEMCLGGWSSATDHQGRQDELDAAIQAHVVADYISIWTHDSASVEDDDFAAEYASVTGFAATGPWIQFTLAGVNFFREQFPEDAEVPVI